ncbi:MAG: DedA family protein [Pseudomonadales bacterium]|nr:DedA family protein [Pseudomonadales bacterium]MCP5330634.1 DedA family protein [Pseudomonadales bacterium]MCP5344264.1 DedA family protein [Pseudomonadales bacterium]
MLTEYALLFLSAFIAATVLPFYSEAFLYVLLQSAPSALWPVLIATAGNVLGSCVNWWLGRGILHFRHRRWFYFNEEQIERAQRGFQRYGLWTLLFAWVPVIGDPLTLIAGVMRVRFRIFVLLVTIGKAARYGVIAWLAL